MLENQEKILVIHSTIGVGSADLCAAREAIREFRLGGLSIRTEPVVFEIPPRAALGASLGTDLIKEFTECVGAIAFVDDLRPNVAYELGLFHGRGTPVLLLTRLGVDSVSQSFSDIGGAPVADIRVTDVETATVTYLRTLYQRYLSDVEPAPLVPLPAKKRNLLTRWAREGKIESSQRGPWGPILRLAEWSNLDVHVSLNLFSNAHWHLVLRSSGVGADYTVYFNVRYRDHSGAKSRIWLGVTSLRRDASITGQERLLPSQTATSEWSTLSGCFARDLRRVAILGSASPDHLETIRFRAGAKDRPHIAPIEVAFLEIAGAEG
jgi:hypothetical protein